MRSQKSESLSEAFDDRSESRLEPNSYAQKPMEGPSYDDPIEAAATLEYGPQKGKEVTKAVKRYVNKFDSLDHLRSELDERKATSGAAPLENIYQSGELNCSARTAAQVAFNQINGEKQGQLNVQYETLNFLGIDIPGSIPVENHVCYEHPEDIRPHDFGNHSETELFNEGAIVGIRAANLLTESENPEARADLRSTVRSMASEGESDFVDGFIRAYELDSMVSSKMPRAAQSAYESITSKLI